MSSKRDKVMSFLELATEDERLLVMDIWDKRRLDGAWKQMQLINLHRSATEQERSVLSEARETVRRMAMLEAWQKVRLGIFVNGNAFHTKPKHPAGSRKSTR